MASVSYSFTLRQLEATFCRLTPDAPYGWREDGARPEAAQGIRFLCPRCFKANGGAVGTHSIICWFKDHLVPDDTMPGPGRWLPSGTGIDDLTFVGPGAASVQSGRHWHGFVRAGRVDVDNEGPE